jgi:MoaA/NifB/PqqE/SkfB family radical SAM enzyme
MPNLSFHLIKNFIKDAVKVKLYNHPRLDPLILAYFVTFRCNFKCTYCGYSRQNYSQKFSEVGTQTAKKIMAICRKAVPAIAFSGGEPLIRDDIVEIVKFAKALNYKPISLFTNTLLLPQREEILDDIDFLQMSLDTLDEKKQDRINGRTGVGKKVKEHIQRYALLQREKNFRINMNCVIGTHNIDDVPDLIDFAIESNVRLTISPQLDESGGPVKELFSKKIEKKYINVITKILETKSKNNVILDIRPFLEHLKNFQSFKCYPSLSARVYPDGSFIFPCPNLCNNIINVFEAGSWENIMKAIGNSFSLNCYE